MKQILKYKILLLAINLIFFACTKDVDFNQINDLELNPVIESSLIFFDEPANRFLENLVKVDLVFETENSINQRFDLQIDFFDNSGQLQHSFSITQEPLSNNNYTAVFEDDTLDALKNTTEIVFTLRLSPGNPPINETTPGTIKLKSKAVFYFNIIDPI